MPNKIILLISFISTTLSVARADNTFKGGHEACLRVIAACETAGYNGSAKNEAQCLHPLLKGQSVKNFTATGNLQSDIGICAQHRQAMAAKQKK